MKHDKEINLAIELANQRKELMQNGLCRIEELVKDNNNRVMLKTPVLACEFGLGYRFEKYLILGFEFARKAQWLTDEYNKQETLNIIYDTQGAGGLVPLPRKNELKYEARTPATAWRLVELVEDALGV